MASFHYLNAEDDVVAMFSVTRTGIHIFGDVKFLPPPLGQGLGKLGKRFLIDTEQEADSLQPPRLIPLEDIPEKSLQREKCCFATLPYEDSEP